MLGVLCSYKRQLSALFGMPCGKMGNLNILGDGCPRWSLWDGCFVLSFFSFFALVSIFGFGLLSLANEESLVPAGDSLLLEIFFHLY